MQMPLGEEDKKSNLIFSDICLNFLNRPFLSLKNHLKKIKNAFSLRSHHIPPSFIAQSVTEGLIYWQIKWLDHIFTRFLVIAIFVIMELFLFEVVSDVIRILLKFSTKKCFLKLGFWPF